MDYISRSPLCKEGIKQMHFVVERRVRECVSELGGIYARFDADVLKKVRFLCNESAQKPRTIIIAASQRSEKAAATIHNAPASFIPPPGH